MLRSRLGPYLRFTTSFFADLGVFDAVVGDVALFLEDPAMLALIFDDGRVTSSWYAELALRRRVKKSAIGSVMVMGDRQPSRSGSHAAAIWFPRSTWWAFHEVELA